MRPRSFGAVSAGVNFLREILLTADGSSRLEWLGLMRAFARARQQGSTVEEV